MSRLRRSAASNRKSNKKQHRPITITAIAQPGNSRGVTGVSPMSVVTLPVVGAVVDGSPSVGTAGVGANVGVKRDVVSGGCVGPVVVLPVVGAVVVLVVVRDVVWPGGVGTGVGDGVRVVVVVASVVSDSVVGAVLLVGTGVGAVVGGITGVGAGVRFAGGVNGGGLPHCAWVLLSGDTDRLSNAKPLPGVADEPMATTKRNSTSLEHAIHESRGIVAGLMK